MAELPPKIPDATTHDWPSSYSCHRQHWVGEFLDFSAARRAAHRRSARDSVTFLEVAGGCGPAGSGIFDLLEDDQILSMFSDDSPPPAQPAMPPEGNANDGEAAPKRDVGDMKGSCEVEDAGVAPPSSAVSGSGDAIVDPKRIKRILANRQSAQRSRVRKLQYISELERSLTYLQTEVATLSPRVAFLDHQRLILNVDNSALKQRIAALTQDKIFKDAHQEALKREIERLRQVFHHQSLKKMSNASSPPANTSPPPPPSPLSHTPTSDKDMGRCTDINMEQRFIIS